MKPEVLVVEDNPADIGLIRAALDEHELSCHVTIVMDGQCAIELIDGIDRHDSACPDLVALDLRLPKRDGFEVLERFRASGLCARTPVVILTSSNLQQDRDRAASLGAWYIRKPTDLKEFIGLGEIFKEILNGLVG